MVHREPMDLVELVAREAIRDLVAAYAHLADHGRFDELGALFVEGGSLQIDDRPPLTGRRAIHDFLGGTKVDLRGATSGQLIRHHTSNLRITLDGRDRGNGRCYFLVVTERGLDHWGRYRDTYVRDGDRWGFGMRHVRVEGMAPGSWAAERRGRGETRG